MRPALFQQVLGVGSITNMPKIKAASSELQGTDVMEVGALVSAYRHIFVIGGSTRGIISFCIVKNSYTTNDYSVYGSTQGLSVYTKNNIIYLQSFSGSLVRPIAWNIGANANDTVTMSLVAELPSDAVKIN